MKELLNQHGTLLIDEPLSKHTTFRIGGSAKYFIYPKNEISLLRIIEICKKYNKEYKVIGKGSNLLCSDDDFDGVVICLDKNFTDYNFEDDGLCYVQAGMSLVFLANESAKSSLSGLEFASGIPATVGGAVYMNAGAYKRNMSDIINRVYVLKDDHIVWMDNKECDFSYRHSVFQLHPEWIILGCELQLEKGDADEIRDLIDARRKRRMDSQPLNKPSAGSVFRNPSEAPAWKLVEDSGLRGKQIGGARVSDKHANFIVNEGGAKATDVGSLVELIQETIKARYGIELKMEVEKFNWKSLRTTKQNKESQ